MELLLECDAFEADVIRTLLESEGINAYVAKDDVGGMRPQLSFTGGAKIYVNEADLEKAASLISPDSR